MTIELVLAGGNKSVFADAGVSAALIWYQDPVIKKGAANGAVSGNYGSLILWDSAGKRYQYAVNNPAYSPGSYEELDATNSPRDIFDAIVALDDFDLVLPTDSTDLLDSDYPIRFAVNKTQTQGITIRDVNRAQAGTYNIYHYLDVTPRKRFFFIGGYGREFSNTFDGNVTFYLRKEEFDVVQNRLEGLC